ncbi:thyroid transcription factor 1-associated protein 26 homolog isoform X1 [Oncorhynchus keta]|uniref:thyroid transcription factor 1-associated protein 26 homolog isoform X1 n=1 Tax=Oncorhynchus keta TaxID=8018 RepID=UPI00227A7662|nr:thyroid transcription factor 1-associated protein 26 homolog isoform X1 [Oncorhynchus keta]
MAPPAQQKMKTKGTFDGKRANRNQPYNRPGGKKKWVSEHKVFDGSIGEGQGFAFKRKEKVKHEYNKLLRKERRKNTEVKTQYTEQYPEHLRHLYEAEAEKLRNEVKTNRINRTKARMAGSGGPVEEEAAPMAVKEAPTDLATAIDPAEDISSDKTDSASQPTPAVATSKNDSLPMSNQSKKTMQHVNVSLCSSLPMSNRSKKTMQHVNVSLCSSLPMSNRSKKTMQHVNVSLCSSLPMSNRSKKTMQHVNVSLCSSLPMSNRSKKTMQHVNVSLCSSLPMSNRSKKTMQHVNVSLCSSLPMSNRSKRQCNMLMCRCVPVYP